MTEQGADAIVQAVRSGYAFNGPAVDLGALVTDGIAHPDVAVRVPLEMINRHGLVAGATGTGKTKTLQLMAEQLSAAGVPVFLADVKGDLSGMAHAGGAERQDRGARSRRRPAVVSRRRTRPSSTASAVRARASRSG